MMRGAPLDAHTLSPRKHPHIREGARVGPVSRADKRPEETYTMIGMKMEGRMLLSSTLVSGSNTAYETKKMVSVALYCPTERPRSPLSPAMLAFPMLVRSRKARR